MHTSLPQQSSSLLTLMARDSEQHWADFSASVTGQVLLAPKEQSELDIPERVKQAFICGNMLGTAGAVGQFLQEGMNAHLLPHRRIRWATTDSLRLAPGEALQNILFIAASEDGTHTLHWGMCQAPRDDEPMLEPPLTERGPEVVFVDTHHGEPYKVANVMAYVSADQLMKTFLH